MPDSDVVHVEDGAWVNAANDWGHPQYINWLWPPARDKDDPGYNYDDPRTWIDIEGGWAEDWRNWSIIVAAANYCETAEQISTGNGNAVKAWKIQAPHEHDGTYNNPNKAEQAWHFMLGGLDSGFMYYGISLDDEVKQTLACNRAVGLARDAIADNPGSVPDTTPPTVFKPQRYPWNPGGTGWGPTTGYRPIGFNGAPPHDSDFYVWTLVHDIAGVTNVTLHVRRDRDGNNPLTGNQNETYAGGGEVEGWTQVAMTRRVLDPQAGDNGNTWLYTNTVPDDAPSATVYFRDGGGTEDDNSGAYWATSIRDCDEPVGPATVAFSPAAPTGCVPVTITYDPNNGPLRYASRVYIHVGHDNWRDVVAPDPAMNAGAGNAWTFIYVPPPGTEAINCAFNDGSVWDNNSDENWNVSVAGCGAAPFILVGGSPAVSTNPAAQNHATDAFDLNPHGNSARTRDQGGFGDFGRLHVNHDATHFYVGAEGCDMAGSNNAMIVFLSLNFGQGAYYLSTGTGRFVPVAGARLSQFDGSGTNLVQAADYDGDRLMNRWETAIPWSSLGASNVGAITDCRICGVIASSSVSNNNRYLSGNYLGSAIHTAPPGDNYGFDLVTLTPQVVSLPGADTDGDGMADAWENEHFGGIQVANAASDWDGDGATDLDEYRTGTDRRDAASVFAFTALTRPDGSRVALRWQSAAGRLYSIHRATNLHSGFVHIQSALPATPPVNTYTDTVGTAQARFYRVEAK